MQQIVHIERIQRILLVMALGLTACAQGRQSPSAQRLDVPPAVEGIDKSFERANRLVAIRSEQQIESYIRRHAIEGLTHDNQGVRFRIDGIPLGPQPEEGVRVAIAYRLELLDGQVCEQADSLSPLVFAAGRREHTVGLDEVIKRMAPGQQALAIVPPHMAYGLVGHGGVPSNACIVYRIEWMRYPKQ